MYIDVNFMVADIVDFFAKRELRWRRKKKSISYVQSIKPSVEVCASNILEYIQRKI